MGSALCRALARAGHQVISVARGRYPQLEEAGIGCVRADIGESLEKNYADFEGAEAVFHAASKVSMWGDYREFKRANIDGTGNIIRMCRACGIENLIYTSSPSVIADGSNLRGVDESYPYPRRHHAYYPATKAEAERLVLSENGAALRTVALRPHLIWGPGDTNLIPTILKKAKSGKLIRIGSGENLVDTTYIEDCVSAHLKALDAIKTNPVCRGKAYFISQGEPVKLWQWIDQILERNGLPAIRRAVPLKAALAAACAMEWWAGITGGEPLFTRFLVSEMATDHYFDISAARRDLGYQPLCTVAEALDRTFSRRTS